MRPLLFGFVFLALVYGGSSMAGSAQSQSRLRDTVDGIMTPILERGAPDVRKARTIVVGVVHGDKQHLFFYGQDAQNHPPTGQSLYPISSITKVFTGLIMAQGEVGDDFARATPAADLLKGDLAKHVSGITLGMLVSHYSGLPTMPQNSNGPATSPYANYDRMDLLHCLAGSCDKRPPGRRVQYSNVGIGLLALALADFYHYPDFGTLFHQKIYEALDLHDITVVGDVSGDARIMPGRTEMGHAVSPARMGVLAGSGGLIASGDDMLKVLGMLSDPKGYWAQVMEMAQAPIRQIRPGIAICHAFARQSLNGHFMYSKGGEQAGYSAFIAWVPDQHVGVFILTDQGGLHDLHYRARQILLGAMADQATLTRPDQSALPY